MANTLAHIAVAHRILSQLPELVKNRDSFYLGTIAPDAIESKAGAVRDDKKLVHLRLGITDMEWLEPEKMAIFDRRVEDFVNYFIRGEQDEDKRDFFVGYLVHLLTDKINHGTVRLGILRRLEPEGYRDGTWDFIYRVLNDLEALDYNLLMTRPEIAGIFYELMDKPVKHCLPGMIEKEYLEKSRHWWKNQYIPQIAERRANVLSPEDMDDFVEKSAADIISQLEILL